MVDMTGHADTVREALLLINSDRWPGADLDGLAALAALEQERDEALAELAEVSAQLVRDYEFAAKLEAAERERDTLRAALDRATYIAEHLFAMVPREVWRDTGGDDGQGHYEGDYHAEKLQAEIAALASVRDEQARSAPATPEAREDA